MDSVDLRRGLVTLRRNDGGSIEKPRDLIASSLPSAFVEPRPARRVVGPSARSVCLVACVARKRAVPCRAADLYDSPWFHKARRYSERNADHWYILSAKYGVLYPDMIIIPYEHTLRTMRPSEQAAWAADVIAALGSILEPIDRILMLAGQLYRELLLPALGALAVAVEVPMAGLAIGEQLQWLDQHRNGW